MKTSTVLTILIHLSVFYFIMANSDETGGYDRIHKEHNGRKAKRPTQTNQTNKVTKYDVGGTLYTLQVRMENLGILDFLIDNTYEQNTYIKDYFGIKNFEIKIVSIQRLLYNAGMIQFDAALADLDIDYNNFKAAYQSYHITYNMLKLLGISVSSAVDKFLSHLDNNSESLFRILKLVNIDAQEFQDTVTKKGEEDFYNLLATGNYDKVNVQTALEIAQVKPTFTNIVETLSLKNEFITQFVLNLDANFGAIMKKLQVTPENVKVAMHNFDIDNTTELQHITPMPILLEQLTVPQTIAIQITEYKAVTHKDSVIIRKFKELVPYAKILGTNIVDNSQIELIPNSLNPTEANYATLWSQDSMGPKFTQLAMTAEIQNTIDYNDCAYAYVKDSKTIEQIKTVPVLRKRQFLVNKTDTEQVLYDGTPLICFEKLYGIAINDTAGKANVDFVSKYPIMQAEENNGGHGFFATIFNTVKSFFRSILNLVKKMFPFNLFK